MATSNVRYAVVSLRYGDGGATALIGPFYSNGHAEGWVRGLQAVKQKRNLNVSWEVLDHETSARVKATALSPGDQEELVDLLLSNYIEQRRLFQRRFGKKPPQ